MQFSDKEPFRTSNIWQTHKGETFNTVIYNTEPANVRNFEPTCQQLLKLDDPFTSVANLECKSTKVRNTVKHVRVDHVFYNCITNIKVYLSCQIGIYTFL